MKTNELKELILSLTQDVTFQYAGEYACINPWNPNKIEVGYGDNVKTYSNIDDVMKDKFYKGKSLEEISEELILD